MRTRSQSRTENPQPQRTHDGPIIVARDLVKIYGSGETEVRALDGISLDIMPAQFTAILGPSGSGKSTLLHALAGLDTVTSGSILLGGKELVGMKDKELTQLRASQVGFIFQAFNLVPTLTAADNIKLPMRLAKKTVDERWFEQITGLLGLTERLHHKPNQLSGGQQQRVAVARTLVSRPDIIVADEPTGNLDSKTGAEVMDILRAAVDELGQTVLMVTHDLHAAARADRALILKDGRISNDIEHASEETLQGLI
ncbi:peptide ABC transporter ATP-binding protein [Boudabousia liubingyangii]|uniref:Peptide ABC transporter ATP-binding protein n=1 Tax=Boudabousia liubingyangii TaxID=1921764 RepID=A0A1Q5PLD1_9ACTO|nr:ABC transporter ATP-binding protein [Boudabousia liubingyangii]OKL47079.1 peptide ABC transporter ATP-binding protein [Boudabousia liubingyangii]OKL47859.1 peptide ABC transporter ATP-binding protein [Boudabousia liubingyangii]